MTKYYLVCDGVKCYGRYRTLNDANVRRMKISKRTFIETCETDVDIVGFGDFEEFYH